MRTGAAQGRGDLDPYKLREVAGEMITKGIHKSLDLSLHRSQTRKDTIVDDGPMARDILNFFLQQMHLSLCRLAPLDPNGP